MGNNSHSKIISCRVFIILFTLLFYIHYAQAQNKSDSLILVFEENQSLDDSLKLVLLEKIYKDSKLNPDTRLKYALISLDLAKTHNYDLWTFKSEFELGNIFKKKGNLDEAVDHYLEALKINQELSEISNKALIYSSLASTYRAANNFEKSQNYAAKGIKIYRQLEDSMRLAISLMNTGEANRLERQLIPALNYFKESGEIFALLNYKIGNAYNIGNIGLVLAEMGDHKNAEEKLNHAIGILKEAEDYYPIIVYNLSMADIYVAQNRLIGAINLVEENLKIAIEHGLKEQIRDANLKLSELYATTKDFQKAYRYQNQYLIYRDSINNEATIRKMADLQTEYQVSQKQMEVDLLENERKQQNTIFIALIIIILLLAFLVFLYYRNYKRKQTLNLLITERKEEVEAQRDQLVALNETKEKFLSIVSHDLLGPVNSFKGLSTIMKASIDANNTKDLQYIHKLFDSSVNNLSTLLTNLLDWSVTQQGAIPYNPEKIVLFNLVNELLDLFANMARAKDINIKSTVNNEAVIWADINSVKTILRNLVSNAIKFTNANGQITISSDIENEILVINVTDTGIGMPQEKIDNLLAFNNYSRSAGTKGERGIGLGLQLVKEFAEMNKGSLAIESKEGIGTTFKVFLPITEWD
jgi:signal transduction histidine kinase